MRRRGGTVHGDRGRLGHPRPSSPPPDEPPAVLLRPEGDREQAGHVLLGLGLDPDRLLPFGPLFRVPVQPASVKLPGAHAAPAAPGGRRAPHPDPLESTPHRT